ncbi:hypothetical protein MAP00_004735 [Monascus purpureus]|nr:hypothetical protein MAP00_004735 [Monascus purpureus]
MLIKRIGISSGPQESTYYSPRDVPTFDTEYNSSRQDPSAFAAPMSRPPSRMNMRGSASATKFEGVPAPATNADTGKPLTLAEREERELQQAMAMSLNQDIGQQETGITTTSQSNFNRATRDDYDDNEWAMTLFNASSREIIISPDPEDRRRGAGEPAFLRPSQDGLYLGGLLTILHSIPLAREALLLRDHLLPNYGHDQQWWNGQPIQLPKITTIHDTHNLDSELEDTIHESQRLMAFLDSTERAFGSVDSLASFNSITSYDSEGSVGRFLENWQEAASKVAPGNQLTTIFSSIAFKRPLSVYDTPIDKEFFTLDPFVDPDPGQTLYDVLDRTMWADRLGEELDDVWLEHIADVLTIKLEASEPSSKSVGVKVPTIFYADRYMRSCRDISREFRTRRLQIYEDVSNLEILMGRFALARGITQGGLTPREALEKAADTVPLASRKNIANGAGDTLITPEIADKGAQWLVNELRTTSVKIEKKLKELELRKSRALESLQGYAKFLTEPSPSPDETPRYRYTLRGVCTEPHVTYVLRRRASDDPEGVMDSDSKVCDGWQWWRISFSTDDAKQKRAEKTASNSDYPPQSADVVGYTTRKVQETEVLQAAGEGSRTALLVYANSNALSILEQPLPPPLQEFMRLDNQSFEAEFRGPDNDKHSEQIGEQELNPNTSNGPGESPADSTVYFDAQPTPSHAWEQQKGLGKSGSTQPDVDVFDYEVSSLDEENGPRQEMQERDGASLLSHATATKIVDPPAYSPPKWDEMDEGGHSHAE